MKILLNLFCSVDKKESNTMGRIKLVAVLAAIPFLAYFDGARSAPVQSDLADINSDPSQKIASEVLRKTPSGPHVINSEVSDSDSAREEDFVQNVLVDSDSVPSTKLLSKAELMAQLQQYNHNDMCDILCK